MAIIKDFLTPHGVTAKYHRIIKAEISVSSQTVELMVAIYASAEARAASGAPLWHEYVRVPFSALTQDPRDLLYPMLSAFGDSYLKGGETDAEGSGAPGNFTINLKPEALEATTPAEVEAIGW
jgi:hypothetical protein